MSDSSDHDVYVGSHRAPDRDPLYPRDPLDSAATIGSGLPARPVTAEDDDGDDGWGELGEQDADSRRVRIYTAVAVVCAVLTVVFLFRNVFLSPVFGFTGAFCSWRGIKNGGNRPGLLVLMLICLLPALFAGLFLLLLIPNLPTLHFGDVHWVNE